MNKLANIKIGTKLALLLIGEMGAVICIGGLGLWALSAIRNTNEQQQIEAEKMMNAQQVGSDLGVVNAVVGHITLSKHCESCHGTAQGGDDDHVRLAEECRSLLLDQGFGQGEKKPRAGLVKVSTHDQQMLPMQLSAMRDYARNHSLIPHLRTFPIRPAAA